jgi:DNA-binding CsgD family transcriptional regulator
MDPYDGGMVRRVASPELVGRGIELHALADALAAARDGQPSLVLIAGEAGIGKTRLVREAERIARNEEMLVLTGGAVELAEGELPYGAIAEALRGLLRTDDPGMRAVPTDALTSPLEAILPELASGVALGSASEPAPWFQARTFDAVLELVRRLAERQPVLVVIEDLHWADTSTRDLLRYVVHGLRNERVVLIATYRSDELHRRHPLVPWLAEVGRLGIVERLELRRLDRTEQAEQLRGILGAHPEPDLVEEIHARSDGNPFYAEELLAVTQRTGEAKLPQGLAQALLARLAQLSDASIEVLETACVGGRQLDPVLVLSVCGLSDDSVESAIREGLAAGLLALEDEEPAFRHALTREAVYGTVLPVRRRRIHARYAEELQRAVPASGADRARRLALVAHHWDAAGHPREALEAAVEAAGAATASHAFAEAAHQWLRAIDLWDRTLPVERPGGVTDVELYASAAKALDLVGEAGRAVEHGREAIARAAAADADQRARLHVLQAELEWHAFRLDSAVTQLEAGVRLLADAGPSAALANALAWLARLRQVRGEPFQAAQVASEAVDMASSLGNTAVEGRARRALGNALMSLGDFKAAEDQLEQALRRAESTGDPSDVGGTYNDLGIARLFCDGSDRAIEVWREGASTARRLGAWRLFGVVLEVNVAAELVELGRWDEASQLLDSLEPDVAAGMVERIYADHRDLLAVRRGKRLGDRELHEKVDGLAEMPAPDFIASAFKVVVEAHLANRRPAEAYNAAADAIGRLAKSEKELPFVELLILGLRSAADYVPLLRASRDAEEIRRVERQASEYATKLEGIRSSRLAALEEVRTLLDWGRAEGARVGGRDDPAAWHGIRAAWSQQRRPYYEAYAAYREAEALLEAKRPRSEAAAALRDARHIAERLGARPLLGWIDSLARRARISIAETEAAPATEPSAVEPDALKQYGLTRREREILGLIARGWTNRRIAEALFISESTASVHVSNIIGKLGVTNRVQAAAIASRLEGSGRPSTEL